MSKFLKTKNGKLYASDDKDLTNPIEELTGKITDFWFKDEQYEGATVEKVYITIGDYKLGLKQESGQWSNLVSFLKNADLSRELTITTKAEELPTGNWSISYFVNQDGFKKGFYKKDTPNVIPAWKPVTIGKKTIWDRSEAVAFLKNVVETEFMPVIKGQPIPAATASNDSQDLPF